MWFCFLLLCILKFNLKCLLGINTVQRFWLVPFRGLELFTQLWNKTKKRIWNTVKCENDPRSNPKRLYLFPPVLNVSECRIPGSWSGPVIRWSSQLCCFPGLSCCIIVLISQMGKPTFSQSWGLEIGPWPWKSFLPGCHSTYSTC